MSFWQIVLGVLGSLFLLNTLLRTIKWKRRFGSQVIDGEVQNILLNCQDLRELIF